MKLLTAPPERKLLKAAPDDQDYFVLLEQLHTKMLLQLAVPKELLGDPNSNLATAEASRRIFQNRIRSSWAKG